MTARTLTSLAHALGAATDLDTAFVALAGALAESDRDAVVGLLAYDHRIGLLRERMIVGNGRVERVGLETSLEQLPRNALRIVQEGGTFADLAEEPAAYARLLRLPALDEGASLAVRGIRVDGQLAAMVTLA